MRETMDKFSLFPFSIGCISHSSVDVIQTHPQTDSNPPPLPPPSREGEELEEEKPKTAIGLAHISKPRIGEKLQKLVKSIKSFPSHVFQVYKDEEEEDDDYEVEMEIGLPTDVQHVGHIGWDGSNNNNNNNINNTVSSMKNWDKAPAEFMYSPSL